MPGALGIVGDIMGGITKGKEIGNLQTAQNKFANMTPEQLSSMVTKATQPLNAGLVQEVGNTVQADVASRGLAESPGVWAATESQTLAPYEQQNQNTAVQLVLRQLGLPIEYASAIMQLLNSGSGSSGSDPMASMMKLLASGG